MKKIKVRLKENSHEIVIGRGILPQLGRKLAALHCGKDAVIVTNRCIREYYGKQLAVGLKKNGFSIKFFDVPDGEKSKSAKVAFELLERIAAYDTQKAIFVVAFGGGVVGDLAGFVAAVYKRGIPYVQVPTTFLAQIDSAIGGKTAIDLSIGKNLVGAFYQPKLIYSDTACLKTLDKKQIRNGLAEAVKYGIICDRQLFDYIEKNCKQILALDKAVIDRIVWRCSQIKTSVVERDEKETKGIRTILNFGHTVGHAIEAAGKYTLYHHGEAVALGMRIAASIACKMGKFSKPEAVRLESLLTKIGLPSHIEKTKLRKILGIIVHDKKFNAAKNRFVLPIKIGVVKVFQGIRQEMISKSVNDRM